jgi:hypothetical protein
MVQIGRGPILAESPLTVPSIVRVTSNGDSHAIARVRQRLKLAAIGYAAARHGIDADVRKCRAGFIRLARMSIEYGETLMGADPRKRPIDPHLLPDNEDLMLAAIAYAAARHGVDADAGMSRAGLADLAQVSIDYYEVFLGAAPRKRPVDPHLQLDNGA